MDNLNDGLDALLFVVIRMVFDAWPDDGAYHVGLALGEVARDCYKSYGSQQPGEWRSYHVDGYRFSIRRNTEAKLEIQREEPTVES